MIRSASERQPRPAIQRTQQASRPLYEVELSCSSALGVAPEWGRSSSSGRERTNEGDRGAEEY